MPHPCVPQVVMTFEESVFDKVVEDLHSRVQTMLQPVLIINLDVKGPSMVCGWERALIGDRG